MKRNHLILFQVLESVVDNDLVLVPLQLVEDAPVHTGHVVPEAKFINTTCQRVKDSRQPTWHMVPDAKLLNLYCQKLKDGAAQSTHMVQEATVEK